MKLIPNWNEHLRLYVGASCFIRCCSLPLCCHPRGYTMNLQLPQIMRTFWWKSLGWRSEKPEKLNITNTPSPTQPGCVWAWRISAEGGGDKAVLFHSSSGVELWDSSSREFRWSLAEITAHEPAQWGTRLALPTHWGTSCQCSCNLKPISPERDVAQAHGSALCLPCSMGRGRQHCSPHPRFSISSIFQLLSSLKTTDEPDSLQRSWHPSPSCPGLPSPSALVCVGALWGPMALWAACAPHLWDNPKNMGQDNKVMESSKTSKVIDSNC